MDRTKKNNVTVQLVIAGVSTSQEKKLEERSVDQANGESIVEKMVKLFFSHSKCLERIRISFS